MNKETKKVIRLISGIQIESLTALRNEFKDGDFPLSKYLLKRLLQITNDDIDFALLNHIQLYVDLESTPQLIMILSEYQLMVCSHILFRMEEEWIQKYPIGVRETWQIIQKAMVSRHPELTLYKL